MRPVVSITSPTNVFLGLFSSITLVTKGLCFDMRPVTCFPLLDLIIDSNTYLLFGEFLHCSSFQSNQYEVNLIQAYISITSSFFFFYLVPLRSKFNNHTTQHIRLLAKSFLVFRLRFLYASNLNFYKEAIIAMAIRCLISTDHLWHLCWLVYFPNIYILLYLINRSIISIINVERSISFQDILFFDLINGVL